MPIVKKFLFFIVFATISLTALIGCNFSSEPLPDSSVLQNNLESNYFICNHGREKGLVIYNSAGEAVVTIKNAEVLEIMNEDGSLYYPKTGEIPKNSYVIIRDTNVYTNGVWDVANENWKIEPANHVSYNHKNGRIYEFMVNNTFYNSNFEIVEGEHPYQISDDLTLMTLESRGYYYIADQNGNSFMDAVSFQRTNENLFNGEKTVVSVSLKDVVPNKYMIIQYTYGQSFDRETDVLLCDLQGNILFPEWNYQSVSFRENQFGDYMRNMLCFSNFDTGEEHFLDIETEQEIYFPDGYEEITPMTENFFLLSNENDHIIYDIRTGELGAQFSTPYRAAVYVVGLNTYVVGDIFEKRIVIDGKEYPVNKKCDYLSVLISPYPIIQEGAYSGYSKSYILTETGSLKERVDRSVIYANEYCCCMENDTDYTKYDIFPYQ